MGRLNEQLCEQLRTLTDAKGAYEELDGAYLPLDRERILRTRNIRLIPELADRRGGKRSYAEWAHVVGIFQTLMFQQLKGYGHTVVDVGCGTGLLGIASEPLVSDGGRYIGLDVSSRDIEFCRAHYPPEFDFRLIDTRNSLYAPDSSAQPQPWDLPDECADLVTALSVWTHMSEEVARYYMKEIARVLRPGRCAIVTAFLLDAGYEESLRHRSCTPGRYHMTSQDRWVFTEPMYGSETFLHPAWAQVPEMAVGIQRDAWDSLLADAGLTMTELYPGNWREAPGLYFQDVAILRRG